MWSHSISHELLTVVKPLEPPAPSALTILKKAVEKEVETWKWKYCMLVQGSWARVPGLKMWNVGVQWALKNGQKPPNLKMYDFVVWDLIRIGSCILFMLWWEKERDMFHVRLLLTASSRLSVGDAVELGVNCCDSRHLTSLDETWRWHGRPRDVSV
jgi:hypothetical protein